MDHPRREGAGRGVMRLIGWMLVTYCAAIPGAFSRPDTTWYALLNRPSWQPPNWIFGPVWTTLYLLMAVAVWRIHQKVGWRVGRTAIGLYLFQLVLNALWSPIFFRWHQIGWALVEIGLLWIAIVVCMAAFLKHDRLAGILLIPYLAWVSFASVLTYTLWTMNR